MPDKRRKTRSWITFWKWLSHGCIHLSCNWNGKGWVSVISPLCKKVSWCNQRASPIKGLCLIIPCHIAPLLTAHFTVRCNLTNNQYCRIMASFSSKTTQHNTLNMMCESLLQAWGWEVLAPYTYLCMIMFCSFTWRSHFRNSGLNVHILQWGCHITIPYRHKWLHCCDWSPVLLMRKGNDLGDNSE